MNWLAKGAAWVCRSRAVLAQFRKAAGRRKRVESVVSRQTVWRGFGRGAGNAERILSRRAVAILIQCFKPLEIGANGVRESRHIALTEVFLKQRRQVDS